MKVLAAMSGGVDSAVAAARAVEAGHDVTGVHLALSRNPDNTRGGSRGCCSVEDSRDARRAADMLGIPFYVWDFSEAFEREVIDQFVATYAEGRTPNPCVTCNEKIKFAALLDRAVALGFDKVATGHYARLDGTTLRRAVDADKDQSYVLAVLTAQQLSRAMFPVGDTPKPRIREEAERRGLAVAHKPDSHDICFIPSGDTKAFLGARIAVRSGAAARPGEFRDHRTGAVLGHHDGAIGFTVGQRRGLRLGNPTGDGVPRYVTAVEPETGVVRVGTMEDLRVFSISVRTAVWSGGAAPAAAFPCVVQIRAHGGFAPARVRAAGAGFEVELDEPLEAVASGQTVVLYDPDPVLGDRVIGSGVIGAPSEFLAQGGSGQ
ncbi:tRNA(5-methylaminomethyl-2-thiouridylate)-methyl transferase [Segniliparus rotundus DSM 44985]|uniref:tRNA-specific 2-thiouridylase MnmA n=1 Tax=Segniliparus rotundus (strain ATCC BAA-972 / CDC 1076 / CIP 108378 / DSM 44985 / JCM 13578) TaxID=640132 RepID=D6Z7V4_SEGRD|nr:tRNA 2-thiouridine(34) synthase MnmA [Segniliparus rotundus]ADG98034.1 tRNA(5-methylaminomethyl-2-thiouridylate)-methyl transferase [Segniliparus rotundus DSM 44985]